MSKELFDPTSVGLNPIIGSLTKAVEESDGLSAKRLEATLDSLLDLQAHAEESSRRYELIRRQASSLRLTGFVDWEEISETNVGVEATRAEKAATKIKPRPTKAVSFKAFPFPEQTSPRRQVVVASILDDFSEKAFSYEWENIALSHDAWRSQIDSAQVLFVESAWAGNSRDWLYCFTGPSAPRPQVIELVEYCRAKGIPSVFWNKEDPPHFGDFLETAALFDVVLTTDEDCVPEYKEKLGHGRVGVLPFAAQQKIHNPVRVNNIKRSNEVAFGGMYFAHKYPERRRQMDYLLPAAGRFNFDIFSRQLGGDAKYQFPEPFSQNVVGSLPYAEMLTAYHSYQVFLNVNSVVTSSTMCARRIFEITASGASVVSPPSPAIEKYFPEGLIPLVSDEQETYSTIRALLSPGGYREKLVHAAQRIIWQNHTFEHRVKEILNWVGIEDELKQPTVSILAPTVRPDLVKPLIETIAAQQNVQLEVNLLTHGFELDSTEILAFARDLGVENLTLLTADRSVSLGNVLNRLVEASSGDVLTKMDDDDLYAPHYLEDLVYALQYSDAEIAGKAASYVHFESRDATILSYEGTEHRYGEFVRGGTITGWKDVFRRYPFADLARSEDTTFLKHVRSDGGRIYASDRFNFCLRRSATPGHHTWESADTDFFASGPVVDYGDPTAHVSA